MDHLSLPRNATPDEKEEIPCLCLNNYKGIAFHRYPEAAGWPCFQPTGRYFSRRTWFTLQEQTTVSPADLEAFIQTWLFFALLQEVLGDLYRHDDFVRVVVDATSGESRTVLSTAKLIPLLKEWGANCSAAKETSLTQDRYTHLWNCLGVTIGVLTCTSASGLAPNPNIRIPKPIKFVTINGKLLFAIAAVGETITNVVGRTFDPWTNRWEPPPQGWYLQASKDYTGPIERMLQNGWCPHYAGIVLRRFSNLDSQHYVSRFKRRGKEKEHRLCSVDTCIAYDPENVVPLHLCESGCAMNAVSEKELRECLSTGELPLLRLSKNQDTGVVTVAVVASTPSSTYVAISHVWADGLGNSSGTALPQCQVSALYDILQTFAAVVPGKEVLLWVDTLCVPIFDNTAQKLALLAMKRTYEQATSVIILEASLDQHEYPQTDLHSLEILFCLYCSSWAFRLWTLQEAALPKDLRIKLKRDIISVDVLHQAVQRLISYEHIQYHGLLMNVLTAHRSVRGFFHLLQSTHGVDTGFLASCLVQRSLSKAKDEPLCAATLLGLDQTLIVAEDDRLERMKVLWRLTAASANLIPPSVIFFPGPRLPQKGFRWAPATFLLQQNQFAFVTQDKATYATPAGTTRLTDDGLVVRVPGRFISGMWSADRGIEEHIRRYVAATRPTYRQVRDSAGRWYFLAIHRKIGPEEPVSPSTADNQRLVFPTDVELFSAGRLYAILTAKSSATLLASIDTSSLPSSASEEQPKTYPHFSHPVPPFPAPIRIISEYTCTLTPIIDKETHVYTAAFNLATFLRRDPTILEHLSTAKSWLEANIPPSMSKLLNKPVLASLFTWFGALQASPSLPLSLEQQALLKEALRNPDLKQPLHLTDVPAPPSNVLLLAQDPYEDALLRILAMLKHVAAWTTLLEPRLEKTMAGMSSEEGEPQILFLRIVVAFFARMWLGVGDMLGVDGDDGGIEWCVD